MAGQNDHNYSNNDSSDEEHHRLSNQHSMGMEPQEENKGMSKTQQSQGKDTVLPDMWNRTDGKKGDGYFIFGAPPKSSNQVQ